MTRVTGSTLLLLVIAGLPGSRGEADEASNPWRRGALRFYGFGLRELPLSDQRLADMGVNLVYGGAVYRLGTDLATRDLTELKRLNAGRHALGMRTMTGTSLVIVQQRWLDQYPNARNHIRLLPNGQPARWKDSPGKLTACPRHPYWTEMHKRGLELAIEAGFDAAHLDNPHSLPCTCRLCRSAWREYARRIGRPGVDLETAANTQDRSLAVQYDIFRYRAMMEMLRRIKVCVKSIKPDFALDFTAHLDPRSAYYWTFGRGGYDIICLELTTAQADWFPPEGESLVGYKVCYACSGNRPVWGLQKLLHRAQRPRPKSIATARDAEAYADDGAPKGQLDPWVRSNPSADRERLYLAEALASEAMVAPVTLAQHHAARWGTKSIPFSDIIRRYYQFMREHEDLYTDTESIANVAVVLSVKSWLWDRGLKQSLFGACEALLREHRLFDIVVAEKMRPGDLDRHDGIVLVRAACLDDRAIGIIERRVSAGAHLVLIGDNATLTGDFLPRRHTPPIFRTQHGGNTGNGRVRRLEGDAVGRRTTRPCPWPHASPDR